MSDSSVQRAQQQEVERRILELEAEVSELIEEEHNYVKQMLFVRGEHALKTLTYYYIGVENEIGKVRRKIRELRLFNK